jgi:hypothetical protein
MTEPVAGPVALHDRTGSWSSCIAKITDWLKLQWLGERSDAKTVCIQRWLSWKEMPEGSYRDCVAKWPLYIKADVRERRGRGFSQISQGGMSIGPNVPTPCSSRDVDRSHVSLGARRGPDGWQKAFMSIHVYSAINQKYDPLGRSVAVRRYVVMIKGNLQSLIFGGKLRW